MTTEIHGQPGIPAHDYPRHVARVLADRAPTKPRFGHSFASPQYRRGVGLTVNGRYDWFLLVAALAVCGLVLAGLSLAFH